MICKNVNFKDKYVDPCWVRQNDVKTKNKYNDVVLILTFC